MYFEFFVVVKTNGIMAGGSQGATVPVAEFSSSWKIFFHKKYNIRNWKSPKCCAI